MAMSGVSWGVTPNFCATWAREPRDSSSLACWAASLASCQACSTLRRDLHLLGGVGEGFRFLDFLQLDQVNPLAGGGQAYGSGFEAKGDLIPFRGVLAPPDQAHIPTLIPAGGVLGVRPGQTGEILPRPGLAHQFLGQLDRLPLLGLRGLGGQGEQDLPRPNHLGPGVLGFVLFEVICPRPSGLSLTRSR